jgi:hypothetical protein
MLDPRCRRIGRAELSVIRWLMEATAQWGCVVAGLVHVNYGRWQQALLREGWMRFRKPMIRQKIR